MTDAYVYWEQQRSDQLCAMHAVNALLQAPIYTEIDLGQIGQALDGEELAMSGRKSNQNKEVGNVPRRGNRVSTGIGMFRWI